MKPTLFKSCFLAISFTLVLFACSEDDGPSPAKFESLDVTSGIEGSTVKINVSNLAGKTVEAVRIGNTEVVITNTTDTYIEIIVPFLKEGGPYSISVKIKDEEVIYNENAFTYLQIDVVSLTKAALPYFIKDTVVMTLSNLPPGKTANDFSFIATEQDGTIVSAPMPTPVSLNGNQLTVAFPQINRAHEFNFYLVYKTAEIEVDGLSFVEMVKLTKPTSTLAPGEVLPVFTLRGYGELKAYINGEELHYLFSTPITPSAAGYHHITAFQTPVLDPGTYTLEFRFTSNNQQASVQGTSQIEVVDLYYCPENNSYRPGDEMKIFLEGGDNLNPYNSYEKPVEVVLEDATTLTEFDTAIEDEYLMEYENPGTSYVTVRIPAGTPPSNAYSLKVRTSNGYEYKLKAGCANASVQIVP